MAKAAAEAAAQVAELARQQWGLVLTCQALVAGLSSAAIRTKVRSGEWRQILRRAYLTITTRESDFTLRCRAALLLGGGTARISHLSALVVHHVLTEDPGGDVHVTVSRSMRHTAGLRVHRRAPGRSVLRRGIAVVPVAEAVLGAWPSLDFDQRKEVLCTAVRTRRTTVARLREEAKSWGSFEGRRVFHELLDLVAIGCHSPIEIDYVLLVERPYDLPPASRQTRFRRRWQHAFGDVFYQDELLLVELDGRANHNEDDQRRADLARDVELATQGIQTLRITGRQIREQPAWVAAAVLDTLAQRRVR